MLFEQEIKQALKNAGLAESLSDKVTVKTVDEIAGAITQLKTDMDKTKSFTTDEFLNVLKTAGLEDAYKKALQSETDRRVTEAIKTHEDKLRKAADDTVVKDKQKKDQETMTPEQKKIQSLEDTLKGITEKLEEITTKIVSNDMDSKVRTELKKQGLSEEFATYVNVSEPEKIAAAVTSLKSKLDAQTQTAIDGKLKSGELAPVKQGNTGQTLEEGKIKEYAISLGKGGAVKNPDFQGKISSPEPAAKAAIT